MKSFRTTFILIIILFLTISSYSFDDKDKTLYGIKNQSKINYVSTNHYLTPSTSFYFVFGDAGSGIGIGVDFAYHYLFSNRMGVGFDFGWIMEFGKSTTYYDYWGFPYTAESDAGHGLLLKPEFIFGNLNIESRNTYWGLISPGLVIGLNQGAGAHFNIDIGGGYGFKMGPTSQLQGEFRFGIISSAPARFYIGTRWGLKFGL